MRSIYIGQLLQPAAAPLIVHMRILLGGVVIIYNYPHLAVRITVCGYVCVQERNLLYGKFIVAYFSKFIEAVEEKSLCMCNLSGGSRISRRGQQSQEWGNNLLFLIIFAKNCIKMKKIGLTGGCASLASLDPPLILYDSVNLTLILIWTLSVDLG